MACGKKRSAAGRTTRLQESVEGSAVMEPVTLVVGVGIGWLVHKLHRKKGHVHAWQRGQRVNPFYWGDPWYCMCGERIEVPIGFRPKGAVR